MQTKITAAPARDEVLRWRRDQLAAAGFELPLAQAVAQDREFDLHALIELVERGCPPRLAVRILAPLRGARGVNAVGMATVTPWSAIDRDTTALEAPPLARLRVAGVAATACAPSTGDARRGDRAPARPPPSRCALRGRPPAVDAAAPARQRARRHREGGRRRRPDERAEAARRFPRREPFHDLGVQVRSATRRR